MKLFFLLIVLAFLAGCESDDDCSRCQFGQDEVLVCQDEFESFEAYQQYVNDFNCN